MKQYLDFLRLVRDTGADKTDRTGTGTKSIFGHQIVREVNCFPCQIMQKFIGLGCIHFQSKGICHRLKFRFF